MRAATLFRAHLLDPMDENRGEQGGFHQHTEEFHDALEDGEQASQGAGLITGSGI
jgi:hypothetical protein